MLPSSRMFVSSEHIQRMHEIREAQYCEKISVELRAELPEQTASMTETSLNTIVATAYKRSRDYGMVTGDGIRRFIRLAVLMDPNFDRQPDVQRFLRMPDLDPDMKIKLLSQLVAQRLREGI